MTIYTGKSADGSDMKAFEGVYTNPDNPDEWSSRPYPGAQRKENNTIKEIQAYMDKNQLSFEELLEQVNEKKCPLSARLRKYILS